MKFLRDNRIRPDHMWIHMLCHSMSVSRWASARYYYATIKLTILGMSTPRQDTIPADKRNVIQTLTTIKTTEASTTITLKRMKRLNVFYTLRLTTTVKNLSQLKLIYLRQCASLVVDQLMWYWNCGIVVVGANLLHTFTSFIVYTPLIIWLSFSFEWYVRMNKKILSAQRRIVRQTVRHSE